MGQRDPFNEINETDGQHLLWRWAGRLLVFAGLLVLLAALGRGLLVYARHFQTALEYPYHLNYGEGPLLAQAVRLANGEGIYDLEVPPYTITNYPPLYMLLQAPLVSALGPAYSYGRLLSLLGIGLAMIALAAILHAATRDWIAALVGALLLPVIPYILHWSALARIDSLALGLSLAGIAVVAIAPRRRAAVIAAALLLTAAAYTRQTYLAAAPLAAFAWLWGAGERRRALIFAVLFGSLVLGLFALLLVWTEGGIFFHIVTANVNLHDYNLLAFYVEEIVKTMPLLVALALAVVVFSPLGRQRIWWVAAPYTAAALATAATISKIGSDINYLYELSAALCLAAGAAAGWLRRLPALRMLLLIALAGQAWLLVDRAEQRYVPIIVERAAQREAVATLLDSIRAADGLVLADDAMGLLPLAGRPILFQPFEMSQLAQVGVWDQAPFLAHLEYGTYPYVLIYQPYRNPGLRRERWTAEMLRVINNHYRPLRQAAETIIYRHAGS
jgi:hypothetical protein